MLLFWSWLIVLAMWKRSALWCFKRTWQGLENRLCLCVTLQQWFLFHAHISPVWLPSAQHQPPVHRLSCIYVVIITKRDLDQIVCFIYKECLLRSGSQSVTGHSNRLKTQNVGTRFRIIVSKQNQRKKQKPEFSELAGTFWQRPTGLFCSRLSHSVRLSPAARRALPATQTVRESMTSPLYHPQDTLKAHSSAGSNARCRWKQRDPSYYSLPF